MVYIRLPTFQKPLVVTRALLLAERRRKGVEGGGTVSE